MGRREESLGVEISGEGAIGARLALAGGHGTSDQKLENQVAAAVLLSGAKTGEPRRIPVAVAGAQLKRLPCGAIRGAAGEARQHGPQVRFDRRALAGFDAGLKFRNPGPLK